MIRIRTKKMKLRQAIAFTVREARSGRENHDKPGTGVAQGEAKRWATTSKNMNP
jgi:hypothetical protein